MSTRLRPIFPRSLIMMLAADRLLLAATVNGLLAVAWFSLQLLHPIGPPALIWVSTPVAGAMGVAAMWRAAGTGSLSPGARRFWHQAATAGGCATIGQTLQGIDVARHPDDLGDHLTGGMQIFDGLAVLLVVYMLYRLPIGTQTSAQLLRVVLDAGTVMLATGVFIWHFETRRLLGVVDRSSLVVSLVLSILLLVAVFGLMKVMLSGYRTVAVPSLRLLAPALIMGIMGSVQRPPLLVQTGLYPTALLVPLVFLLTVWSAEMQRASARSTRRARLQRQRRSYSLLPYMAIAAVDGLLIDIAAEGITDDILVVVIAAVTLTALVVGRQITSFIENGKLLEQLDHSATHDALTQLPNRVLFTTRLQQALSAHDLRPVSVALVDLDDFKEVNDNLGHEVGDLLLKSVARRLADCMSATDTVARLGGDEFVVVLDGADRAAADRAAERMISALSRPVAAGQHELPIRASIGIADGRTGDDVGMLLRHADIAMYAAKRIAGTAYLHHRPGMDVSGAHQAHLGAQLRAAIGTDQLLLTYQPIIALADGRLLGTEVLVGWAHPDHGMLSCETFTPLAERSSLIVRLNRWVLDHALSQLALWSARHGTAAPAVLKITISARHLSEPDFASEVARLLAAHGIDGGRLVLTITGTAAVQPGAPALTVSRLRELGVRISLDDFGSAHSALAVLHEVTVDEITLGASFTRAAGEGRTSFTAAVLHLARSLGLHAVAKGIETQQEADQLYTLGCPAGQGTHFAGPASAHELDALLDAGTPLHTAGSPKASMAPG